MACLMPQLFSSRLQKLENIEFEFRLHDLLNNCFSETLFERLAFVIEGEGFIFPLELLHHFPEHRKIGFVAQKFLKKAINESESL